MQYSLNYSGTRFLLNFLVDSVLTIILGTDEKKKMSDITSDYPNQTGGLLESPLAKKVEQLQNRSN